LGFFKRPGISVFCPESSPGEFDPKGLAEPYVNVSIARSRTASTVGATLTGNLEVTISYQQIEGI